MKIIVVSDSDGHTSAYAYNQANLLRILRHVEEIGMLEGEIPENPTMEQLEEVVANTYWIDQRGGQLCIVDLQDNFDPPYNPF
jgi:hypothetical protein